MKRDMELIRDILLRIEEFNELAAQPSPPGRVSIICYHANLLLTANLIEGIECESDQFTGEWNCTLFNKPSLTWAGHEFLDSARDDATWNAAKNQLGDGFATASFAVIVAVLIEIAKEKLGLLR